MLSKTHLRGPDTKKGYFLLLLTAALWGTAFIFQKNATVYVDAFVFNTFRFGIAVPALLLLKFLPKTIFLPDNKDIPEKKRFRHSAWFIGFGGGVFLFLGISLQQWGLSYTTAGKSGFLTSLYIIIIPIMAIFLGQRCRIEVWFATMLTILGMYLLGSGANDNIESQFNIGDAMTGVSAFAWAAQVLWLSVFARYANVLNIAIIQMLVSTILSVVVVLFLFLTQQGGGYELPSWSTIWVIKNNILYTGVIAAAAAFTLQILGQRYVPATNAALIMSTEAVFALISGILFLDEKITFIALIGCFFIMVGIILSQLQGKVFSLLFNKSELRL